MSEYVKTIDSERAWQYHALALAAGTPLVLVATVSGIALRVDHFARGALNFGMFTSPLIGYGAYQGLQYVMGGKKKVESQVVWEVFGYFAMGSLFFGGTLHALGRLSPARVAPLAAQLSGSIAGGSLIGFTLASLISAGMDRPPIQKKEADVEQGKEEETPDA